jgi:hypothetical protein
MTRVTGLSSPSGENGKSRSYLYPWQRPLLTNTAGCLSRDSKHTLQSPRYELNDTHLF